jgi:hypothetical protein
MKKIKQIDNFKRIEVKTDYSRLRDLLYAVNGVMIKYNETYAFPNIVNVARKELIELFKQIAELKPPTNAFNLTRDKVLSKGRILVTSMNDYLKNFQYDDSCIDAASMSARYQVYSFLQSKDIININDALNMMRRNILINDSINEINIKLGANINERNFNRLQDDLITLVKEKIDSYAFAS